MHLNKINMDYEKLSQEHFDRQAAEYDSRDTFYYSREGKISCRDIAQYLQNEEYSNLLDVGCGTGYLFDLLQKQRPAEYWGLDLSSKMIEVAQSKNIPGTTFIQGKANELPFDDESFDIVVCSQSFHHYPYQNEALEEAKRVLRPRGLFILSDSGMGGFSAWFDNNILFKLLKSGDCYIQNRKSVEKRMKSAGFEVVDSRQLTWMIYTVVGRKV